MVLQLNSEQSQACTFIPTIATSHSNEKPKRKQNTPKWASRRRPQNSNDDEGSTDTWMTSTPTNVNVPLYADYHQRVKANMAALTSSDSSLF